MTNKPIFNTLDRAPLKPNVGKPAFGGRVDAAVPSYIDRAAKSQSRGSLMHKRANMPKDKRS